MNTKFFAMVGLLSLVQNIMVADEATVVEPWYARTDISRSRKVASLGAGIMGAGFGFLSFEGFKFATDDIYNGIKSARFQWRHAENNNTFPNLYFAKSEIKDGMRSGAIMAIAGCLSYGCFKFAYKPFNAQNQEQGFIGSRWY